MRHARPRELGGTAGRNNRSVVDDEGQDQLKIRR